MMARFPLAGDFYENTYHGFVRFKRGDDCPIGNVWTIAHHRAT
jgi:hypothetical protein